MEAKETEQYKTGWFNNGGLRILITIDAGKWHLSISHPSRLPKYAEIKHARYDLLPDGVYMAEIFPPKAEFVNLHPYTRHLYQINPG